MKQFAHTDLRYEQQCSIIRVLMCNASTLFDNLLPALDGSPSFSGDSSNCSHSGHSLVSCGPVQRQSGGPTSKREIVSQGPNVCNRNYDCVYQPIGN